jgi:hypothetical protein
MGRLAEGASELAAEVGPGELRGTGKIVYTQRLEVAGIHEILGAQKVAIRWDKRHARPVCRAVTLFSTAAQPPAIRCAA